MLYDYIDPSLLGFPDRNRDSMAKWNTVVDINNEHTRIELAGSGLQVYRLRVTWVQKDDIAFIGQGTFSVGFPSGQATSWLKCLSQQHSLSRLTSFSPRFHCYTKIHTKIP